MSESSFIIGKTITNNFTVSTLQNLLHSVKKGLEFSKSGQDIDYFISDLVNKGIISVSQLSEFLFENLLFGSQRRVFIRRIHDSGTNLFSENEVLNIMRMIYKVDSPNMNRLAYTSFVQGEPTVELSAFKIIKENNILKKIYFIFCEQVRVNRKLHKGRENSYITVELDLVENLIITKVSPKTKIADEAQYPDVLANKYTEEVMKGFGIVTNGFVDLHKMTIYKLCSELTDQVFKKICLKKSDNIKEIIESTSDAINDELNIQDYKTKATYSHIFNIKYNLDKLIDHILISDAFYSKGVEDNVLGIDGLVTYIRFSDGKNVNAVLKGENSRIPIFDSEAFMGLRSTIESSGKIVEAHVNWYQKNYTYRLKYDAMCPQFLVMHFYQELDKGEFEYAYKKYKQFESGIIGEIQSMGGEPSA